MQVVSATGEYDPAKKGFIITFTIEEGPQYRFGTIDIQSNVRAVDSQSLRPILRVAPGAISTTARRSKKTVEDITVEMSRRGYPFGTVRPRGDRNPADANDQRRLMWWTKARAPTSSASTSAAIPVPAIM